LLINSGFLCNLLYCHHIERLSKNEEVYEVLKVRKFQNADFNNINKSALKPSKNIIYSFSLKPLNEK